MKLFVFAVRDRASDQFGNPFYFISLGQAIRHFADEVNNVESGLLYKHPDDYDCYLLGEFDTSLGTFDTKVPEMVSVGKNVAVRSDS